MKINNSKNFKSNLKKNIKYKFYNNIYFYSNI